MKKSLVFLLLIVSTSLYAKELLTFTGLKAYDGDTIRTPLVVIKGLPPLNIRLFGIDTPEMRGKCEEEKKLAILARDRLNEILKQEVTIQPMKWDKYGGRFIATIYDKNGKNVAETLINEGLGRPYFGDKKESWCSANDNKGDLNVIME